MDITTLSHSCDVKNAPDTLSTNLQSDTQGIMKRSNANKMILSESKMKCMFVTGKRLCKCMENDKLSTQVNGKQLGQVEFQKLLGVLIDDKFSLVDHISEL